MNKKVYNREYYLKNKEKATIDNRKWYLKNKELKKATSRKYHREHKEHYRALQRKWKKELKREVLTHYGNGKLACVHCGFTDVRALSIDHINNDGAEQRRKTGKGGIVFYIWLKQEGFPEGHQTLCMNCQWIKRQEIYD